MRLPHRLALLGGLLWLAGLGQAFDRTIYVTNWSQYRKGECKWRPADLPPQLATRVLYAFAFLNEDFSPKLLEWNDEELIAELQALKQGNPELKTQISIGGWTMNTPDSGYSHLFSSMVATPENRAAFINATLAFCDRYGFDGVDIDWEYPGREDRGGRPEDRDNFVLLLRELRQAINGRGQPLLLTLAVAAASGGWGGYDLPAIHPEVDGIYLMTYDYHGSWETVTGYNAPWEDPQGPEGLRRALDYFIGEQGVPAEKVSLGLGLYGRSWTLDSPDNSGLGAPAGAAGAPGNCTGEAGFLGWSEIKLLLEQGAVEVVDSTAMQAYAVLGNQWVSYDNPDTLGQKVQAARDRGLGGVMVWSADLDDADYTLLNRISA